MHLTKLGELHAYDVKHFRQANKISIYVAVVITIEATEMWTQTMQQHL